MGGLNALTLGAAFNGFAKGGAEAVSIYNQQIQQQVDNRHKDTALGQDQQRIDLARDTFNDARAHRDRAYQDVSDQLDRERIQKTLLNINSDIMMEMKNDGATDRQTWFRNNPKSDEYLAEFIKARFPKRFDIDADIKMVRDGQGNFNIFGRGSKDSEYTQMMTMNSDEAYKHVQFSMAKFGIPDFYKYWGIKSVKDENGKTVLVRADGKGQLSPEQQQKVAEQNQINQEKGLPPVTELEDADDPADMFIAEFEKQYATPRYLDRDQSGKNLKDAFEAKLYNPDPLTKKEKEKGLLDTFAPWSQGVVKDADETFKKRWKEIGNSKDGKLASGLQKAGLFSRSYAQSEFGQFATPIEMALNMGKEAAKGVVPELFENLEKNRKADTVINPAAQLGGAAKQLTDSKADGSTPAKDNPDVDPKVKEGLSGTPLSKDEDFLLTVSALTQSQGGRMLTESQAFVQMLKAAGKGPDGEKAAWDILNKELEYYKKLNSLDADRRKRVTENNTMGESMVGSFLKQFDSSQGTGKNKTGAFSLGKFKTTEQALASAMHRINNKAEFFSQQGFPVNNIPVGNGQVFSVIDWSRMTATHVDRMMKDHVMPSMVEHGEKAWWKFGDGKDTSGQIVEEGERIVDDLSDYLGSPMAVQEAFAKGRGMTREQVIESMSGKSQ